MRRCFLRIFFFSSRGAREVVLVRFGYFFFFRGDGSVDGNALCKCEVEIGFSRRVGCLLNVLMMLVALIYDLNRGIFIVRCNSENRSVISPPVFWVKTFEFFVSSWKLR